MKIKNLNNRYVMSFVYIIFLFPLFPTVFQGSQVHINLIILALSLIPLVTLKKINLKGFHSWVLLYYFTCQLLLLPAAISDVKSGLFEISSILSLFRPVLLYISFLSLFVLLEKCDIEKVLSIVPVLIGISFLYMIYEVFLLDSVKQFVHFFYKRELRVNLTGISTTFFGTSYFSGFVFYLLYILSLARLDIKGNMLSYFLCFLASLLVILSQSKTMILALIISTAILFSLSSKKRLRFSLYVFLILAVIVVLNLTTIFDSLSQFNLNSIKQIKVLIFDTSQSETLNARNLQISYAIEQVYQRTYFLGVGLTPSKSLETWLALFIYRYGFLGVLNFSLLCIMICFFSYKIIKRGDLAKGYVGKAGLVLGITLPITQMSSAMIEFSKMSFFFAFYLALICVTYNDRIRK